MRRAELRIALPDLVFMLCMQMNMLGLACLEAAGHEDGHDCQASQAHPQGPRVQLPCGALVSCARSGQVGQRAICGVAYGRGVGDVVRVNL